MRTLRVHLLHYDRDQLEATTKSNPFLASTRLAHHPRQPVSSSDVQVALRRQCKEHVGTTRPAIFVMCDFGTEGPCCVTDSSCGPIQWSGWLHIMVKSLIAVSTGGTADCRRVHALSALLLSHRQQRLYERNTSKPARPADSIVSADSTHAAKTRLMGTMACTGSPVRFTTLMYTCSLPIPRKTCHSSQNSTCVFLRTLQMFGHRVYEVYDAKHCHAASGRAAKSRPRAFHSIRPSWMLLDSLSSA